MDTASIKINSVMIEGFSEPINKQTEKYMYIQNGQVTYKSKADVQSDLLFTSSERGVSYWEENKETRNYVKGDLVIYQNRLYQCVAEDKATMTEFVQNEWTILAGYYKESLSTNQYAYTKNDDGFIESIKLIKDVYTKDAITVNINNAILQSREYNLEDDNRTIVFTNPLDPQSDIEILVYENMILPTNVSNIISKEFEIVEDETTQFYLGVIVKAKELVTVNVNGRILQHSEWSILSDFHTIELNTPLSINDKVQISWFNNTELNIGGTYEPQPERKEIGDETPRGYVELGWTLDNTELVEAKTTKIYDGATFIPNVTIDETSNTSIISWNNNGEYENPKDIIIKNGITYTPKVEMNDNTREVTISWSETNTEYPAPVTLQTVGINVKGQWSPTETYKINDYVTYEDADAQYTYIALKYVEAGTELTNEEFWLQNTKTFKNFTVARIIDWSE